MLKIELLVGEGCVCVCACVCVGGWVGVQIIY